MHDWFVTVLVSVRDMAAKSGMAALAEEMDVAILVAANEAHDREMTDLGTVDVGTAEHNPGKTEQAAGPRELRRYH
ncbi:MAG: hypothetical protein AAF439_10715 [Pseudomonadota bacterium]